MKINEMNALILQGMIFFIGILYSQGDYSVNSNADYLEKEDSRISVSDLIIDRDSKKIRRSLEVKNGTIRSSERKKGLGGAKALVRGADIKEDIAVVGSLVNTTKEQRNEFVKISKISDPVKKRKAYVKYLLKYSNSREDMAQVELFLDAENNYITTEYTDFGGYAREPRKIKSNDFTERVVLDEYYVNPEIVDSGADRIEENNSTPENTLLDNDKQEELISIHQIVDVKEKEKRLSEFYKVNGINFEGSDILLNNDMNEKSLGLQILPILSEVDEFKIVELDTSKNESKKNESKNNEGINDFLKTIEGSNEKDLDSGDMKIDFNE